MILEFIRGSIYGSFALARNVHPGGSDLGFTSSSLETTAMSVDIRLADTRDIPSLQTLIVASVRTLQASDYSLAQLELALQTVYGIDTQLISDGTYFAAEAQGGKIPFSIPLGTQLRFGHSLFIPIGHGAESEE
jgi:hypothetical protein